MINDALSSAEAPVSNFLSSQPPRVSSQACSQGATVGGLFGGESKCCIRTSTSLIQTPFLVPTVSVVIGFDFYCLFFLADNSTHSEEFPLAPTRSRVVIHQGRIPVDVNTLELRPQLAKERSSWPGK